MAILLTTTNKIQYNPKEELIGGNAVVVGKNQNPAPITAKVGGTSIRL
jgi:hypothetical protein